MYRCWCSSLQEGSLATEEGELQSLNNTLSSLKAELGTDLLSQLDVNDQEEVGALLCSLSLTLTVAVLWISSFFFTPVLAVVFV